MVCILQPKTTVSLADGWSCSARPRQPQQPTFLATRTKPCMAGLDLELWSLSSSYPSLAITAQPSTTEFVHADVVASTPLPANLFVEYNEVVATTI